MFDNFYQKSNDKSLSDRRSVALNNKKRGIGLWVIVLVCVFIGIIVSEGWNLLAASDYTYSEFQQDIQNNKYTQQQAEAVQAGLQKQNADLQALQQRLGAEFQAETEKFNKALRDSIQHYLAVYNKDKKFSLILSKAGDNILYADKTYDITNEVIAGLNKAYKPVAKKK